MSDIKRYINLKVHLSSFPYSKSNQDKDIYQGNERISFQNRHPIYKTLMKLEFEDAIRNFMKKNISK